MMRIIPALLCSALISGGAAARQVTAVADGTAVGVAGNEISGLAASSILATPYLGVAPLAVVFEAPDEDDQTLCAWNFGDGASGYGLQISHTYTIPGTYVATLSVYDMNRARHVASRFTITVSDGSFNVQGPVSANEARRFLWQAGFGPSSADVASVMAGGYEAWIDAQRTKPASLITAQQLSYIQQHGYGYHPDTLWNGVCVEAADQLRQRMAWALLQIMVMNDPIDSGSGDCSYYSSYIQNALGNYRSLLGYVTRSRQMGVYLTYIGSSKANLATGTFPDENFAREVMQLFTIGLVRLNPDGTPVLDTDGATIPTYDNSAVQQFARVFTGFRWPSDDALPMLMAADSHEFGAKQLLNYPGAVPSNGLIPATANQTIAQAQADVDAALDNLVHHPNFGPFLAAQLIKRLTTSNPTPQYVAKVARALEGTGPYGTGVRGDLFAAAKAILLDPEARDPVYRSNPFYGKPKEPLVMRWGLYRAFQRVDRPGETFPYRINADSYLLQLDTGQDFMASPSVFNFYLPSYVPPLTQLARSRMTAPELQICNDYTVLATVNRFKDELVTTSDSTARFTAWRALAGNPQALVSALNDELMFGSMPQQSLSIIQKAVTGMSGANDRVRCAVWLFASSPEFRVIR